jgi:hypothetical protein
MSTKHAMLIAASVSLFTLSLLTPAVPATPLTQFIDPLTQHSGKLETIEKQLMEVETPEDFYRTGENLLSETEALHVTLHKFVNAQTRRGTMIEFELIEKSVNSVQKSTVHMFALCEKEPSELIKPPKISDVLIKAVARELVDKELAERGLDALVGVKSRKDVRNRIVPIIMDKYKQKAQDVTERLTKMRFYNISSAREALKNRLRQRLQRVVEKISIKLFGKASPLEVQLVVSFFEKIIYPELREWLRPKGNVHNRTKRSVATMKESINELSSLGYLKENKTSDKENERSDKKNETSNLVNLKKVRRALNRAKWRIEASKYLVRDLPKPDVVSLIEKKGLAIKIQKSKINQFDMQLPKPGYEDKATRQQLANWLDVERKRLERNMHITKYRFMLENLDKVEKVAEDKALVRLFADILGRLLNSDCFEEEEISDRDPFGIEHEN